MLSRRAVFPVLGLLGAAHALSLSQTPPTPPPPPACNTSLYCSGELLRHVQLAHIFNDSKIFVDLRLVHSEADTLADFARLMNDTGHRPSRAQLVSFVDAHFQEGNELTEWQPPDFDPSPPVLAGIADPALREYARDVVALWARLGRRVQPAVRDQPDRYSLLYVPNGFIAPGGRFKEMYYWDTFWIVRGLLISNMTHTARGMVENLLYLVERVGYVPNGSRVYYLGRSQPPLLAAMVAGVVDATGDVGWLARHVPTVERELEYWLRNKAVTVEAGGREHTLLHYHADEPGPRPESFREDWTSARPLRDEAARQTFYHEMRSAAESGWDFSSRWFLPAAGAGGNLTDVRTTRIVPVDLNAIFAGALQLAGDFRARLRQRDAAARWWERASAWRDAVDAVLWHEQDGTWYDYDTEARAPRRRYYPSCAAPLWAGAAPAGRAAERARRLLRYLRAEGALGFPGGVPVSALHTGEQWDFPNAWPPLQSMLVGGLDASGDAGAAAAARELARVWVRANYLGYRQWQKMFEKYSALRPGQQGEGGEYLVQEGFGWTNGVVLEMLQRYGGDPAMTAGDHAEPHINEVL